LAAISQASARSLTCQTLRFRFGASRSLQPQGHLRVSDASPEPATVQGPAQVSCAAGPVNGPRKRGWPFGADDAVACGCGRLASAAWKHGVRPDGHGSCRKMGPPEGRRVGQPLRWRSSLGLRFGAGRSRRDSGRAR